MLNKCELGIHPPGALGVAFFVHGNAECLIGRTGDGITHILKNTGFIRIMDGNTERSIPVKGKTFANLLEADTRDGMPELLFVCCNPNQLDLFTLELTRFLESLAGRNRLSSVFDIKNNVPIMLVLPNGILSEQVYKVFSEQLNESILMDRLIGITEDMIQPLMDRIVRGISLQAGGRKGSGEDTTYILEKKGSILFAGGGEFERERIEEILSIHDYPYTHARNVSGTRIEFDKAMISIVLNVGGLIHTVRPSGELIDLRMADLCKDPSKTDFIHTITKAVFDVGQAVAAYDKDDVYEEVWAEHRNTIMRFAGHVTSSLKSFRDALAGGLNNVKLFSNEEWILTPLQHYAANAGMNAEEELFKSLKVQVQQSMARAIKFRDQISRDSSSGAQNMKLAAQRNISIELYEAGIDDIVLIGTMLDNEHLIKLEFNIHLPDEQITRSKLDMIRVPFPVCSEVEAVADRLVGLRIERGVLGDIGNRVGGRVGCSHIKELATSIVYFVASYLVTKRVGVDPTSTNYSHTPPEERFRLTKDLLQDSCLAYCQTTAQALDERIGIRRVGEMHSSSLALGEMEPSIGHLLKDRAHRWGNKVYMRYRVADNVVNITWNEFADTAFQIARSLIDQGIKPRNRICMISENRAEMFMSELATMAIGALTVPVFAGYPSQQLAYVLRHSNPKYVIVSGYHQLIKIDKNNHPGIEKYYCMDFDDQCADWGALPFAELTSGGGASLHLLEERIEDVKPEDPCMIMYTSGTTGPPKGVKLSHQNLISQQKAISLLWDVDDNDVFMSYLPWHHSFGGLFERFMTFYNGCELCLDDSRGRDIDRMVDNWEKFNPSLFFSVPRVHDLLLSRCRLEEKVGDLVFGRRLRFVFTAGASLPAPVEAGYREHNIPVREGWGLTETSPCVTVTNKDTAWRSGYVGDPIPGVSVRIGGDQEIMVQGPNVMLGYLDDEEATSHVIDEEGWFHTGDLGEFTRDGLRIIGRKDGAFKLTTGEKVHPQRLENTIANESPYISNAVVVGSGKDFVGALIYPNFTRLREWAVDNNVTCEPLTDSDEIRKLFISELERINPKIQIKYQRIQRAILAQKEPSLERGELTPSSKLVRQKVCDTYKRELEMLFTAEPPDMVIQVNQQQTQQLQGA